MAPILFRCPIKGVMVQSFIADDPSEDDTETYQSVPCAACSGMHFVNASTGRVLNVNDD